MNALTKEFINLLHQKGLHVHPFTVNEKEAIHSIFMLGADGVFTDRPDIAIEVKNKNSSIG